MRLVVNLIFTGNCNCFHESDIDAFKKQRQIAYLSYVAFFLKFHFVIKNMKIKWSFSLIFSAFYVRSNSFSKGRQSCVVKNIVS